MLPAPAISISSLGRVWKFYKICANPEFKGKISLKKLSRWCRHWNSSMRQQTQVGRTWGFSLSVAGSILPAFA